MKARLFTAAAAAIVAATPLAAPAAFAGEHERVRHVEYMPSALHDAAHVAAVRREIRRAAESVCDLHARGAWTIPVERTCEHRAIADAEATLEKRIAEADGDGALRVAAR